MKLSCLAATVYLALFLYSPSQAEGPPQVLVTDSGVQTGTIGRGAPAHTVGLQRHQQTIVIDTAAQRFGLRYVVARDPKKPNVAIPGEGYIGMPLPAGCNWYASGFFDLRINGKSIGTTLIHSLNGRRSEGRGVADFVFDTSQAVVRVRFVARAGEDCLYAQALLEPKVAIQSVQLSVRCYPSAFVTDADRHVLTATRDYVQGQKADLDVGSQWWTLYYDSLYDAGYIGITRRGVGPCAMLLDPDETTRASVLVGGYGINTVFDLKPARREFRFVFLDYDGTKNKAAMANLQGRAPRLLSDLKAFAFTDPSLANWSLPQQQADVRKILASVPSDKKAAAQYECWARELAAQLKQVRTGAAGAIMAEANAAKIIGQWKQGLPALTLKALLNEI